MTDARAWPIRPKWHRFEAPESYARRQCAAAGVPFDYVERGLTTEAQPYIYRVWTDATAAASTIEAAAGRPEGHFLRLKRIAQPDPTQSYPERFLCRLCAAGERVEQIPHDRENWCLRHPGQLMWVGPGTTPESQVSIPFDRVQMKAEQKFRRLVTTGRIGTRLHARVWEMLRDNVRLTWPDGWKPESANTSNDSEVNERAFLYPATVAVLEVLSRVEIVDRWRTRHPEELRGDVAKTLPPMIDPVDVLVERIVLWLRPMRRETRTTRVDTLSVPRDVVDATAIIDTTAPYPNWIQRHPHAIIEWDWARNDATRDPWDADGVSRSAWWLCDEGHSWEASPATRGYAVTRCPYCSRQSVWPGHTDLGTTHPELATEWDLTPGRNAGHPDHVGATSNRRIHWRCAIGHEWISRIRARTIMGNGCPYCGNKAVLAGFNDLATTHPHFVAQWDDTNVKSPTQVTAGSEYRATWVCELSHTWEASVTTRVRAGSGCPYCANKAVLAGFNDLTTLHPDLSAQWDTSPGANTRGPTDITPGSSYRANWICDAGHRWRATVASRARRGRRCPYCYGTRVIPGQTDLATRRPDLAAEWDPSNNLNPGQVAPASGQQVTWRCINGHSWRAKIANRTAGSGCPFCAGQRAVGGETDLATLRPDLIREWSVSNELTPDQVTVFSTKSVRWLCTDGHLWEATVANRSRGYVCPYCTGKRPASAEE